MNVQLTADTASPLPELSLLSGMELNVDLYTDSFHSLGAKPIEFFGHYAAVQCKPTKYTEGHIWKTTQTTVVYIEMGGVTIAGSIWNPYIVTSTLPTNIDEELRTTLISTLKIMEENLDINSEDSDLFYEFNAIFMNYGEDAIHCLQDIMTGNKINAIFAGKLLRHLGYIANDFPTNSISWLLENFLTSKKIPIRNSAVLGLAYLNDPETTPALQKALEVEHIPEIKSNIQQTLEQLINTSKCRNTYEG